MVVLPSSVTLVSYKSERLFVSYVLKIIHYFELFKWIPAPAPASESEDTKFVESFIKPFVPLASYHLGDQVPYLSHAIYNRFKCIP